MTTKKLQVKAPTEEIVLRVSEAMGKDVGRGLARIDPEDINRLGAHIGDIVLVSGKRSTAVKLMPAFKEERGKGIIQVDGIVRQNAGAGLDEKVRIKKVPHQPAKKIVLAPSSHISPLQKDRDARYVGRLLEGLPMVIGDVVRATLFGSRYQEFSVIETSPKDVVTVQPSTIIRIRSEELVRPGVHKITYEDIGGLDKEIQRIREMIELPLKYPQVFERLGIEAPRGVLLHGPPGTGKTLIARAVAYETDAYFRAVNGPEVIHKFYGESEAKLRGIFDEATRNAPAIIFIDEIDAISPKRESVLGEVEKRVVAQLLALMDGLAERGQVIVIGATNIPNAIDPALRRPGRFDREISIGIPDQKGRLEVLEIHTRGMPLTEDVDLRRLSEMTHGFVGADLEALCREAAMIALRKILPRVDFDMDLIPYETLLELEVTMDNFLGAFTEVEPSAIREVFIEVPNVKWEEVGGLEGVKQELVETVEWPLKFSRLFAHAKMVPPKGILLHGPPGTGKTLIAKALATESEVNFISIKGPALLSKWVGESEKAVREVFKKARQAAPCIVFFDEIDAIAPVRGTGAGSSHVTERVISQLLTELDGIEELSGVLVLAATNRLDIVDPALLRPGRFDSLLEIPIPDREALREIFKIHTQKKPLDDRVDLTALVEETEGFVGAEIESLCRYATKLAIREFVQFHPDPATTDFSTLRIKKEHFSEALKKLASERGSLR